MGSLGMPEILMILVIALIIFGPRKLPELGKSLGQGLAHFRKASEDFKRQWEEEVDTERRRIDSPAPMSTVESSSYSHEFDASASGQETPHVDAPPSTEAQPETEAPSSESSTLHDAGTVSRETGRDWV